LQVLASLRAQWAEDRAPLHVDWVVRDIFAPFVKSCAVVDRTYEFKRYGGTIEFLRLIKELRKTRYDYVFDFQGLLRTGLMTWRTLAKIKAGRCNAREGATAFYNVKVPLPPAGRRSHKLDILLQFLPVLDLEPSLQGRLRFREIEKLKLSFIEGKKGVKPVVIFPDSKRAEKNWLGYRQLTKLILQEDKTRRVIWAGLAHMPDKGAYPSERFLNLTGNTSLLSLPALINRADWVIANESGPLHLAAALGVKNLAVLGTTDPRVLGPYPLTAPENHVIQAPVGNLSLLQAKEVYSRFLQYSEA
ncbi:MAG: glycosyltransferase family 9 protein, partial [Opitutaceae bacterium]